MPSEPLFSIDRLDELADMFEALAKSSAAKYRSPVLARGAMLAFKRAAEITRHTVMRKQDAKS